MAVNDKKRWKDWADRLRQRMMSELTPDTTIAIADIAEETATNKPLSVLQSRRFWQSCQAGQAANDTLAKAGFDIDFEPNDDGEVDAVTLRLNKNWMAIMQRVLDRQAR